MNDEHELLASGYLDDALTDEERARAEADPEVMAAVDRMAELRQQLSAVDAPDPARRDAAIKAALDVFAAERPSAAPPPVTSLSARRGSRWLMPAAAAALVAIVAAGIVATRGRQDDGNDASGGDTASVVATDAAGEAIEPGAQVLSDTSADPAGAPAGPADEGAATTGAAGTEAPGTESVTESQSRYSVTTEAAGDLPVITSRQQLTQLAAAGIALFGAPPCDAGTWLGRALLRTEGRDVVVDVFVAKRTGRVRALDPASCEVLLSAAAP